MSLGEKISQLRKSKGISQELLAENAHVSLRTIQRIESGASVPRPYTIKAIAEILQIPVEQLSTLAFTQQQPTNEELTKLLLINLSGLVVLLAPIANIILPLILWHKNKAFPLVNVISRKIISFQILWTLVAALILVCSHIFFIRLMGSSVIGHYPPTLFLVYFVLVTINFVFTIRAAIQLKKEAFAIYSFVPTLF
jgi:transcriptional regulator with XRE-family HTH domain